MSGNRAARPGPPPVASPAGLGGPGPGGPAGVLRRRRRGNLASSLTRTPFAPPSRRARPTKALPPPPSAGRCLWRLQSQRHLQVRCQQGEQRGRRRRPHGRDEQTAGQEVGVEAPQDSRSPGSPCSPASERPCPAPGASSPGMATQGSVPRRVSMRRQFERRRLNSEPLLPSVSEWSWKRLSRTSPVLSREKSAESEGYSLRLGAQPQ